MNAKARSHFASCTEVIEYVDEGKAMSRAEFHVKPKYWASFFIRLVRSWNVRI